jgi:hypothetical protein
VHSERIITHAESKDNICGELAVVGVSHGLDRTPVGESWQANRSPGLDRVRWINGGIPFQRFSAIAKASRPHAQRRILCIFALYCMSARSAWPPYTYHCKDRSQSRPFGPTILGGQVAHEYVPCDASRD